MVDSRQKGARFEAAVVKLLTEDTGLNWKRTPGSGALHQDHLMKGDCYIPGEHNYWVLEVKHYKDDHLTSKVLTDKESQLSKWWTQAKRQGKQTDKKPILMFKKDRGKVFVALLKKDAEGYLTCTRSLHLLPEDVIVVTYEEFKNNIMVNMEWVK